MILLDTSALIASLSGGGGSASKMRELIAAGERLVVPTLVLYEWWRGPRTALDFETQEALLASS